MLWTFDTHGQSLTGILRLTELLGIITFYTSFYFFISDSKAVPKFWFLEDVYLWKKKTYVCLKTVTDG